MEEKQFTSSPQQQLSALQRHDASTQSRCRYLVLSMQRIYYTCVGHALRFEPKHKPSILSRLYMYKTVFPSHHETTPLSSSAAD
jgi:hypothetical protein